MKLMMIESGRITAVKVDGEWLALRRPPINVEESPYVDLDVNDRKEGQLLRVRASDITGVVHG